MSETNDILRPGPGNDEAGKLSEDKLMAWLEGKLPEGDQHEVEKWIAEEGMESDAMEGLRGLAPTETKAAVNKLNHKLRKTIQAKKHKRRPLQTSQFTLVAIAVVLLLIVVAYLVLRKFIP